MLEKILIFKKQFRRHNFFLRLNKPDSYLERERERERERVLEYQDLSSDQLHIQNLKESYTLELLNKLQVQKKPVQRPSALEFCHTLDDFALFFGTDKSSELHDICNTYEFFLKEYRNRDFNLFEYGVLYFASLNTWGAYFKNAHIFGIDPGQEEHVAKIQGKNITYIKNDAFDPVTMKNILREHPPLVIIDDASHYYSHQISGFELSFPYLEAGGYYIIEDTATSFGDFRYGVWNNQKADTASYFARIALLVNGGMGIDSHHMLTEASQVQLSLCQNIQFIALAKNSIIIKKQKKLDKS